MSEEISIHALREEGDQTPGARDNGGTTFLSTPSARRATCCLRERSIPTRNFYPRPPRGGRPAVRSAVSADIRISIHALREEGDVFFVVAEHHHAAFLSTPSARRATWRRCGLPTACSYFYPRPPRGGRQQKRRKTSPLLFHYKTICTDLEEPVQKHPKKEPRSAQNGLKTWCEGDGKGVSAFHSH